MTTAITAAAGYWPGMDAMRATEQSDETLVKRAQAGDTEAFSELARRHELTVYNLSLRFMRNPSLAEDMSQEAFLKAYQKFGKFRRDSQFSTWLYRIACNVCLSELQKRKRRGELSLAYTPELSGPGAAAPLPQAEEAELIRKCVARLPRRYAEAITLFYLQECSYEEVAEIMEIPVGTLKTWLHRARGQLRRIVQHELRYEDEE
ncbi:MAG TPA: sigma-70 family RNA polymerase sigma factor [Candidatus Hydrogenedentes bacterium]|nr:sigma-70 family RNA polymerase sigma factor [Candidatus Hydrogenedentota bacterium]